jgi:uncharacterized damage-inducible protein DinB
MTNEQAEFLLHQVYLPQIQNEHKTTKRVIAAVPADKCDWKPHPDSMGALELAWHIASADCFFINGVVAGKFERGGSMPESIKTSQDVVNWFDENFAKASAALAGLKGDDLTRMIDFAGVFNFPAIVYVGLMSNHSIHHRGQLSAYLRPMGAKVPRIYGGSGDEPVEKAPAAAKA